MDRTERVELTTAVLLRRGSEILLQNRVKGTWTGYALPGGHVEPGESIVEAACREMREETGLQITAPKLCGIKQFPIAGGRYLVFLFLAEQFAGELKSSEEGTMEWISREKLGQYPCVEGLEAQLDVMEDPNGNEFQYVKEDGHWKALIF